MAINVSNPTSCTGRQTLEEAMRGVMLRRRQDLAYLNEIAKAPGARRSLSTRALAPAQEVKAMLDEWGMAVDAVRVEHTVGSKKDYTGDDWNLPKHPDGAVPLCNLMYGGQPIRPTQRSMRGNCVEVTRRFGGVNPPVDPLRALRGALDGAMVREALLEKVYTGGTQEGFNTRLALISSSHARSIYGGDKSGSFLSRKKRWAVLDRLLPVDNTKLPDWHGDTEGLFGLLKTVKITRSSSAGAPYWTTKGDALEKINSVIALLMEHVEAGTVDKLMKEQPELFVIECKNKADRYDVGALKSKTRPYFNPPAHFGFLMSFLMQGFSKALIKCGNGVPTWNAYGWSAAHGGIERLIRHVQAALKDSPGTGLVYGDDGDLYFKHGGRIFRVSPDARQMDSCVDTDAIELAWDWVEHKYTQQHGPNASWSALIRLFKHLMLKPMIMVAGTCLYTKEASGLMSGMVGTTLIDGLKASVAYAELLEAHVADRGPLMREDYVASWLLERHGLVVKPGTWSPEPVNFDPVPLELTQEGYAIPSAENLYGSGTFLGIQYCYIVGPKRPTWVPWLPEKQWCSALLAPRDSGEDSRSRLSQTGRQRLNYDRIRGYLTTGAALSPVREALHLWTDNLEGAVILMEPHGMTPPEGLLFGDPDVSGEFEFPSPDFYPSWKWVVDLYAPPDNQFGAGAETIFSEEVMAQVHDLRRECRVMHIKLRRGEGGFVPEVRDGPQPPIEPPSVDIPRDDIPKPVLDGVSHWNGHVPERAKIPATRPYIPIPGAPYDLQLEQTREQAFLTAAHAQAVTIQEQAVGHNVKPLEQARLMFDHGGPVKFPQKMIDSSGTVPLVHPPTLGGILADAVHLDAKGNPKREAEDGVPGTILVHDALQSRLKLADMKVGNLPTVNDIATQLLHLSGLKPVWQFKQAEPIPDPSQPGTRAKLQRVTGVLSVASVEYESVEVDGVRVGSKARVHKPVQVQIWSGASQKQIKLAFAMFMVAVHRGQAAHKARLALNEPLTADWVSTIEALPPPPEFANVEDPLPTQKAPPPEAFSARQPVTVAIQTVKGFTLNGLTQEPEPAPPLLPKIQRALKPDLRLGKRRYYQRAGKRLFFRTLDDSDTSEASGSDEADDFVNVIKPGGHVPEPVRVEAAAVAPAPPPIDFDVEGDGASVEPVQRPPPPEQPRVRRPRGGRRNKRKQRDAAEGASALVGAKAEATIDPLHDFRTISTAALLAILRERRYEDAQKSQKTQQNPRKGDHRGNAPHKENRPPPQARQERPERRYEDAPGGPRGNWGRGERARGRRDTRAWDRSPYDGVARWHRDWGSGSGGSFARAYAPARDAF